MDAPIQPRNHAQLSREATPEEKRMIEAHLASLGRGAPPAQFVPETPVAPAVIAKDRRYVFRSRPGTVAKQRIRIPAIPPPGVDETEKRYDFIVGRYEKKFGSDALARYDQLVDANGGAHYVDFTTVRVPMGENRFTRECFFQTDSADLAAFVRQALSNDGRFYEDVPPITVEIGGKPIEITVTNDAERAQVLAALGRQLSGETPAAAPTNAAVTVDPSDARFLDKNGKLLTGKALTNRLAKLATAG